MVATSVHSRGSTEPHAWRRPGWLLRRGIPGALLAAWFLFAASPAAAEPYLALMKGLKCSSCHLNRTGGGGRNDYGSGIGRQELPAAGNAGRKDLLEGLISPRVRFGADLRGGVEESLPKDAASLYSFEVFAAQLYGSFDLIADRVSLYVDESVAPGTATNREAFALLRTGKAGFYVKAGQFFPPFGLRLQDDAAATRAFTGFTFLYSDVGVEVGVEPGSWSFAAAAVNGNAGGPETNNGKQVSFVGSFVRKHWRIGLTGANNDLPSSARRTLGGVFGGARAGPVVFLGEWDGIRDVPAAASGASTVNSDAAHLEADWTMIQGLTLRAWGGRHDPDRDVTGDSERQAGVGLDWTPLSGMQLRAYYRNRTGPQAVPASRESEARIELHLYF